MNCAKKTVLIVEDEPLIRLALADEFTNAGYLAIEASNVLEAVGALSQNPGVQSLVTDVDMPGMLNGLALVNLIRNCYTHIDIAVISGRPDIDQWLPEGAVFFPKPYELSEIVRYIDERLNIKADMLGTASVENFAGIRQPLRM